jgi:aldose 1-epimerase
MRESWQPEDVTPQVTPRDPPGDDVTEPMIELAEGDIRCRIAAGAGGRVGSLEVHGTEVLVTGDSSSPPMQWGSFPMVPYAGRVRDGRFEHEGTEYRLPIDLAPHAIHGTAYQRPWTVEAVDDRSVELRIDLGDTWPLGGWAHQRISLSDGVLRCELAVTAADRSMPAQVGWHPWFRKPSAARLRFGAMYERDDVGIPSGAIVSPPSGPWDDCFVEPLTTPSLTIPGERGTPTVEVLITSDCSHWVVYDRPDHATCVEPQSGPPDGFTLDPVVLAPGQILHRWMQIEVLTPSR